MNRLVFTGIEDLKKNGNKQKGVLRYRQEELGMGSIQLNTSQNGFQVREFKRGTSMNYVEWFKSCGALEIRAL